MEVEIISDDEFIMCDQCGREYEGECTTCGPLTVVEDVPVPRGTPDRAEKTTPSQWVYIEESPIHGLGVFAGRLIPARVRFGPYQGERIAADDKRKSVGYAFDIEKGGRLAYCVDAQDVSQSNWLRYINCARYGEEQNLQAFQYRKQIYYRTTRDISPGHELLVWYGDRFAKALGLLREDGTPTKQGYWVRHRGKSPPSRRVLVHSGSIGRKTEAEEATWYRKDESVEQKHIKSEKEKDEFFTCIIIHRSEAVAAGTTEKAGERSDNSA